MVANCNCECNQLTRSATAEIKREFTDKFNTDHASQAGNDVACHLSPETFSINETEFTVTEDGRYW